MDEQKIEANNWRKKEANFYVKEFILSDKEFEVLRKKFLNEFNFKSEFSNKIELAFLFSQDEIIYFTGVVYFKDIKQDIIFYEEYSTYKNNILYQKIINGKDILEILLSNKEVV